MNLAVSTTPSSLQPDAGPLAWVIEQVRDNLLAALAAVRKLQHMRAIGESDEDQSAKASLLQAKHQVHQAAGAIDLLGYFGVARLAQAAERLLALHSDQPETFDAADQSVLEAGLHALLDYLDAQRSGKQEPALKLFKQYRDLTERTGGEPAHPADLWDVDWSWPMLDAPSASALALQPGDRAAYERALLDVLRVHDLPSASATLATVARHAQASASGHERAVWWFAEGFFEALGAGLLPADLYAKRLCNRLNLELKSLLKGQQQPSRRLAHELLFFCSQALGQTPENPTLTPALRLIGKSMHVNAVSAVDYRRAYFGLVDPTLVQQARKRIAQVKEGWAQLSGEDFTRMGKLVEAAQQLGQWLREIAPGSEVLPAAIERAARAIAAQRELLTPDRVLEVATALLFLETSFAHFQADDPDFLPRARELAMRLERSAEGAAAGTFAPWMEELYRKSSESQTLGSVAQELRHDMATVERLLDAYFRDPATRSELAPLPKVLAQMRGVLSVLGLDVGAQALGHIRQTVEELIARPPVEEQARAAGGLFDQLASNIGTLGFMVDMLSYQPELAKSLFNFDTKLGELRAIVASTPHTAPPSSHQDLQNQASQLAEALERGLSNEQAAARLEHLRVEATLAQEPQLSAQAALASDSLVSGHDARAAAQLLRANPAHAPGVSAEPPQAPPLGDLSTSASPSPFPAPAVESPSSRPAAFPTADQRDTDDNQDLLDIFLEEADEVIAAGHAGVKQLQAHNEDDTTLTAVRRAFHTLKGSSRMVGLTDFGEAAWALEQVFNQILAEQRPASAEVLHLADRAFNELKAWTDGLRAGNATAFSSADLCDKARAARGLPSGQAAPMPSPAIAPQDAAQLPRTAGKVATSGTSAAHIAPDAAPAAAAGTVSGDLAATSVHAAAHPGLPALTGIPDDAPAPPTPSRTATPNPPAAAYEAEFPALELPEAALLDLAVPTDTAHPPSPSNLQESDQLVPTQGRAEALGLSVVDEIAVDFPALADSSGDAMQIAEEGEQVEFRDLDAGAFDSLFATTTAPGVEEIRPEPPGALELASNIALETTAKPPSGEIAQADRAGAIDSHQSVFVLDPAVDAADASAPAPLSEETATFANAATDGQAPSAQVFTLEAHRNKQPAPDENIKVVGDLRIPIPLYTVYLNEADELARRLSSDVAAWSLLPSTPVSEEMVAAAHQLRGSSRTVGLQNVGQMAELLEQALELQRQQPRELQEHDATLLAQATEDIRRLLHQFAAGFLQPPRDDLVEGLGALVRRLHTTSAQEEDATAKPEQTASSAPETRLHAVIPVAPPGPVPSPAPVRPASDPALRDSIDADLFPIFEDEATELLPGLSAALREWEMRPHDTAAPKQAMRLLHTFKGSARMAGAMALGDQAHSLESDIEALLGIDAEMPSAQALVDLVMRLDALNTRFERLREASSRGETELGDLNTEAEEASQEPAATPPLPATESSGTVAAVSADPVVANHPSNPADVPSPRPAPQPIAHAPATPTARVAAQPVRVRAALLDRLVNQVGEVSIARARLDNEFGLIRASTRDLGDNLDRLRAQVRDIELQADAQMTARAQAARDDGRDFDPLEFDRFTRFQELTRMMAESVNDLALVQTTLTRTLQTTEDNLTRQARLTRELQRDLLRTRMVEFDSIAERLYRTVRQAGKDAAKAVRLDIQGGTIEIDRGVLDRMAPTFEHILRNAVAHGLESAEVREAAGKPAAGTITLRLRHEGSEVVVSISDDGAGLNYEAIERKARATGLLRPDEQADEAQLREVIFLPGFSSKEETTEMAGRGVGLDVVRTDTRALGGRVELDSVAGKGTTFTLVLPLTTAVTQVVLLRAGSKVYATPASLVDLVLRLRPEQVTAASQRRQYEHGSQTLPFYWLGALTAESGSSTEPPGRTIPVVLVRSAAQPLALQVDEVLGNQEVVIKNLGPQLSRVPGIAGISVLPNGNLVLIYNPVALAAVYGQEAAELMERALARETAVAPQTAGAQQTTSSASSGAVAAVAAAPSPVGPAQPGATTVLVVDDSITVRRVTQRFLSRNGFVVVLAKDGLDALEQLQGALPDVVLTDIEMPRMDGFDLTRNIRADARTRHLPVIMITSRIADKHRNYAQELGVNHYLGKPYSEEELLGLIRTYTAAQGTVH